MGKLISLIERTREQLAKGTPRPAADSLRFLHCSPGALRNICYSQEQMARMTPLNIKPAFTKERFEELIEPLREGTTESVQFETVHFTQW